MSSTRGFATATLFLFASSASCQGTCLGDSRSTKDVTVKELHKPRLELSSADQRLRIEVRGAGVLGSLAGPCPVLAKAAVTMNGAPMTVRTRGGMSAGRLNVCAGLTADIPMPNHGGARLVVSDETGELIADLPDIFEPRTANLSKREFRTGDELVVEWAPATDVFVPPPPGVLLPKEKDEPTTSARFEVYAPSDRTAAIDGAISGVHAEGNKIRGSVARLDPGAYAVSVIAPAGARIGRCDFETCIAPPPNLPAPVSITVVR
jgi:hypothetical protein